MSGFLPIHLDVRSAFRQRLLTLILATTGPLTNVSATAQTWARSGGSFLTDGFGPGDEIMVSGSSIPGNNGRARVQAVNALQLTTDKALTSESAGAAITILASIPQGRAWEGVVYQPTKGQPFLSEASTPISSRVRALGNGGTIQHLVAANVSLFYPSGEGTLGVERMAGALLLHFPPGLSLVYGTTKGTVMSAERKPLIVDPDWTSCPVTFTVSAFTANP